MTRTLARLWHRISRRPEQTTTTTLTIDTGPFSVQMTRFAESWQNMQRSIVRAYGPALTSAAETLGRLAQTLSPSYAANQPVHVAGLEARYFIRAGLDPAYSRTGALDLLVQQILTGVGNDLRWVNDENRALIAASALSGWVSSYADGTTVRVLAWHRRIGDTHITVGRAS